MTTDLEQLSMQFLDAVDHMNAVLRNLQVDYMELLLYDRIINGDMECEPPGLRSSSVFFRVRENLCTHLAEMEKACTDMQALHREMMRK